MQTCKAALPQEKIQRVLQGEILPRFTSCFMQSQEATAPNGRSMEEWLQGITAEMKESIEKHLTSVFQ